MATTTQNANAQMYQNPWEIARLEQNFISLQADNKTINRKETDR